MPDNQVPHILSRSVVRWSSRELFSVYLFFLMLYNPCFFCTYEYKCNLPSIWPNKSSTIWDIRIICQPSNQHCTHTQTALQPHNGALTHPPQSRTRASTPLNAHSPSPTVALSCHLFPRCFRVLAVLSQF